MAVEQMWRQPKKDITLPEERADRESTFQGLTELGIDLDDACPICLSAFNSTNPADELVASNNRLYSCGCRGTNNRHVFHEYCLATHCSQYLVNHGRGNSIANWDRSGVPCPTCRQPINGVKLIHPNMHLRPALGGTKRKRKNRRRSRRYK
jgi:hypothetical protein